MRWELDNTSRPSIEFLYAKLVVYRIKLIIVSMSVIYNDEDKGRNKQKKINNDSNRESNSLTLYAKKIC